MRGEEIKLKTEADDTVFMWLYVCIKSDIGDLDKQTVIQSLTVMNVNGS